ncbi:YicC/YloC family endoribonuclease [Xylanivirga thermophila]|jgi:uncharacterized protein (TIGR00255 family)|uniref:YicC/YloC family endoribonuclease n=1 Tax=Xylanivirga thermophila TaxID=2496273 RepID=UPI00101BB32C|nr:YicC/YloC family endoribonuclease [Xylanivirga thermophila]
MAVSMTGFGRGIINEQGREISVEIKTLNHRFLDINLRIPRNISFVEENVRSLIQSNLSRGRVEVFVDYVNTSEDGYQVDINDSLLKSYLASFERLEQEYNIRNDMAMSHILGIDDIIVVNQAPEDEELIGDMAKQATMKALELLKTMRKDEGHRLQQDISMRADMILDMTMEIEKRAPLVVEEYKEKLGQRLSEILKATPDLDEARFNTEVAYFADRSNITEELVRLDSHINQLKETLVLDTPIGRKLDFLVQEMNRETNTIGSKANDLVITNYVVEMKSELEKIREQIQNIE